MPTKFSRKDISGIMDYLASFELPGIDSEERSNYLNFSLDRFLKTLELFPEEINDRSRVLELGASPYFMSLLVKKYYNCGIEFANFFGASKISKAREVLSSKKYNETYDIDFKHFNVEKEKFPYRDKSFDLVLFCEIIEHLTVDPVHTLVQINRLLRDGGCMIITTPNALRYENIAKLVMGKNIHDHYSGYGAYGRHNREYTPEELRLLVESMGFSVVTLYTKVTGSIKIEGLSIKRVRRLIQLCTTRNRGSNIFLLARKVADADYNYPGWLFESMHEVKKPKKK
jgi:SAM-dependent methyltransferase